MRRRVFLVGSSVTLALPIVDAECAFAADEPAYNRPVLRTMQDKPTSLRAAAAGHALVVVVMKGHWCRVCLAQMQRLTAMKERLGKLGVRVVGLNADSVKANSAAAKAAGLGYAILSDRDHEVISALGLWLSDAGHPMPAIVVFDACGKEAGRLVGRGPGERPEQALLELLEHTKKSCGKPNA